MDAVAQAGVWDPVTPPPLRSGNGDLAPAVNPGGRARVQAVGGDRSPVPLLMGVLARVRLPVRTAKKPD